MPEAFLEDQRRTRVFPVARCGDDQQCGKLGLLPLSRSRIDPTSVISLECPNSGIPEFGCAKSGEEGAVWRLLHGLCTSISPERAVIEMIIGLLHSSGVAQVASMRRDE
jgi:hypothetical protein